MIYGRDYAETRSGATDADLGMVEGGERGEGRESINMSHHHRTLATLATIGLTPAAGSAKFYCLGSTLVGQ